MTAAPAESSSRRLRAATAALHRRVEEGMDLSRRTETLAGYVALLLRMEAFYRAFEPLVARHPFFAPRAHRLRDDLDALGPWSPLPAPSLSLEEPLGGLYVIEGAALGGQIVARHLLARHGLDATNGASFFAGGGDPVGPRWKAFRALLDETDDYGAVERSAAATFLAFEREVVLA